MQTWWAYYPARVSGMHALANPPDLVLTDIIFFSCTTPDVGSFPTPLRDDKGKILRRLAAGERLDHLETLRRRKDGSTLDVSLTNFPSSNKTLESIITCLKEPSLARRRASYSLILCPLDSL